MTEKQRKQRKIEIDLEEINGVPLLLVKDPDFCFQGITNKNELEFIYTLGHEEWNELGRIWINMVFDDLTEKFKDLIFETYSGEYTRFQRDHKISVVLGDK